MKESINEYFIEDCKLALVKDFDESVLQSGKSLYEVIRVMDGVPLFLDRHLDRLKNSAELVNIALWLGIDETKEAIGKLIQKNENLDGNVKIVFNYSKNNEQNKFLAYYIEHHYPSEEEYKAGVATILFHGERSNPNAKVINNNFREKVNKEIKEAKVYEAILVDSQGHITEGSRSNIFMVRNNAVITAPVESVLPGITRDVIINICKNNSIAFAEEKICYKDINELEGLFISGTSPKVLPVCKIDDISFNSMGNAIIEKVKNLYDEYVFKYIKEHK